MRAVDGAAVPGRSVDRFLGGLVTLVQPERGHRAGLDAALLQALVPADASGCLVDLGTGVGTVAFSVAARARNIFAVGLERDPELVACGVAALQLPENAAFAGRVRLLESDVTLPRTARERLGLRDASVDWVLMNPPYHPAGRVRASADPMRRSAHVAEAGALAAWSRTAAGLLKPGGLFGVVHRPQALPEIMHAATGRFGEVRIMPVRPSAWTPASRVLVRSRRGSRAPLQILPGLVLHQADGSWTAEADAILRGRAAIGFPEGGP